MTKNTDVLNRVRALTTDDVMSVYSGKDGSCCCGCSGKHSYNPKHRVVAGRHRGYVIDDNEVNPAMVKKVLRIVQEDAAADMPTLDVDGFGYGDYVSTVRGGRLYVVYLR